MESCKLELYLPKMSDGVFGGCVLTSSRLDSRLGLTQSQDVLMSLQTGRAFFVQIYCDQLVPNTLAKLSALIGRH